MPPTKKASTTKTPPNLDDYLYDDPAEELRKRGIYYITGAIDSGSLVYIQQDILLKHLGKQWPSNQDITIIINSGGGDVAEGWALIDLLKFIRMDTQTIGLGECSSLGATLLAAGTIGKRVIAPNCSVMIHGCWTRGFIEGDKSQMEAKMKWTEQEHGRDLEFWKEHSKHKTATEVTDHLLIGKDLYLTAEDALKHQIVDQILVRNKKK